MPRFIFRKYWLIRELGNYAITISSRHVFRRKHRFNPRMIPYKCLEGAEGKPRTMIRTANRPHGEGSSGGRIGAKDVAALDFSFSIQAVEPVPDGSASDGRRCLLVNGVFCPCSQNCRDDL